MKEAGDNALVQFAVQRLPAGLFRVAVAADGCDGAALAENGGSLECCSPESLLQGTSTYDAVLLDATKPHAFSCLPGVFSRLARHGSLILRISALDDEALTAALRDAGGIVLARKATPAEQLVQCVRADYDPVHHAREILRAGMPVAAFDLLGGLPLEWKQPQERLARIAAEMQLCLLAWHKHAQDDQHLTRFYIAQGLFYEAIRTLPHLHQAYLCQADFWRQLGDPGMAAALLRSLQHVAPTEAVAQRIELFERASRVDASAPVPPEWRAGRPPRVLMVVHSRPHYGPDVLYDGLCRVCGPENIDDYPWKPTLHGVIPEEFRNYPCTCDQPGAPLKLDDVLARLRGGYYDLVAYSDIEQELDASEARAIADAAGNTPFVLVDGQDDPLNNAPKMRAYLERESFTAYFKREMLACVDYGANAYPLPFAYPDKRIPDRVEEVRPRPLFWAGHRMFGLRRLYLERVEQLTGLDFSPEYSQAEYARAIAEAQIGISIFGWGYDTVRYWELPAHGCMLLSERLPIRVPHNFVEGESAVFFGDAAELEEKLRYFLEHPEKAGRIAAEGRRLLLRHHTGSARARQFLGWALAGTRPPHG